MASALGASAGPAWRSWLLTVAVVLAMTTTFPLVAVPFVDHWPWGLRLVLSAVYVVSALRVLFLGSSAGSVRGSRAHAADGRRGSPRARTVLASW